MKSSAFVVVQYRTIDTRRQLQLHVESKRKRDIKCEEVSAADEEKRKREKKKLVLDDVTHTHTQQTSLICFKIHEANR